MEPGQLQRVLNFCARQGFPVVGDRLAKRALSQRGRHLRLSAQVAVFVGLECQLLL